MTIRRGRVEAAMTTAPASRRHALGVADVRRGGTRAWAVLRDAGRKFYADDCPTLAAAISFYALLSLIPVLFLVIAILGYVVGSSQETFRAVLGSAREFIPHLSDDFTHNLEWVVANRGRLSWLGLGTLVVASGLVFHATEFALDRLFAVGQHRGFVHSRLLSMSVVVAMGVVLLFSFYVGVLFHALNADPDLAPFGEGLLLQLAHGLRIQYLTSVMLVLASFTLALRVFPHAPVGWREAFLGACIGTVLWEVARRFFLWYLANMAQFYVVYGSLGALVAVMVWIYMSATIFLYAAECVVLLGPQR
ncbi:MAG: YihY/virulence factor BrkB family protein [Deltaproteobacteria bacterium]|nr:YihY/virulence factor BrkB family protein [Deltaproteobacteria bacterium]